MDPLRECRTFLREALKEEPCPPHQINNKTKVVHRPEAQLHLWDHPHTSQRQDLTERATRGVCRRGDENTYCRRRRGTCIDKWRKFQNSPKLALTFLSEPRQPRACSATTTYLPPLNFRQPQSQPRRAARWRSSAAHTNPEAGAHAYMNNKEWSLGPR